MALVNSKRGVTGLATTGLTLLANPAMAHHATGGRLPGGLGEGLLSGMAHPVIGPDHLAFVVGMGILAALSQRPADRIVLPMMFTVATVMGAVLHLGGVRLPAVETILLITLGGAAGGVLLQIRTRFYHLAGGFMAVGLFHGYAYGESIVGAEPAALGGYLAGFGAVQVVVAVAAGHLYRRFRRQRPPWAHGYARVVGAAMALVAVVLLLGLR